MDEFIPFVDKSLVHKDQNRFLKKHDYLPNPSLIPLVQNHKREILDLVRTLDMARTIIPCTDAFKKRYASSQLKRIDDKLQEYRNKGYLSNDYFDL